MTTRIDQYDDWTHIRFTAEARAINSYGYAVGIKKSNFVIPIKDETEFMGFFDRINNPEPKCANLAMDQWEDRNLPESMRRKPRMISCPCPKCNPVSM